MDSFSGIRIFVSTVEQKSFSKAAERLHLSQSAVSKAIRNLETRLGLVLFYRTTRQLKLTEAGQSYYETCSKVLKDLKDAEENLSPKISKGKVRIDMPFLYGKKWVLPIVLGLAEKYPDVHFELGFNNKLQDLIKQEIDLVIRIGYLEDNSSLSAHRLGEQAIAIVATPAYLKKHGRPKTIDDLKKHECIADTPQSSWVFLDKDGKSRRQKVPSRLILQGADACLQAALAGRGVTQVPQWLAADFIERGELEALLPGQSPALPIHALWLRTRQKTPKKIRLVIDELLKRL
jgi:Transcriptional regulator